MGGELRMRYLNTIDGGRSGFLKGNMQYADNGPATGPNAACPAGSGTTTNCYVDANGFPYGGTGNAQANELMSLPAFQVSRGKVFGGPFNLRTQEYGFFVQDDWKVNSSLTLNLGLRYDLFTPPSETSGRTSYYFPDVSRVVVASGAKDRIVSMDKNNFGPRVGFAYALNKEKSMVIRGGYGLLYTLDGTDYPPSIRNPPFTNSVNLTQFQDSPTTRTYFSVNTGPPSITTQVDPATLPNAGLSVYSVDRKQKIGYVHQFQVSYQWQFSRDWSLDVGYVGNRSRNLLTTLNIGSSGTGASRNAGGAFLQNVLLYTNAASSKYDGLQTQVQKRFSRNIQGQISYTFSHTTDNGVGLIGSLGDSRSGGRSGYVNPFDINADNGRSSLDIRHLLSADAIIDLPFGKGQKYLSNGGSMDRFVSGWQINIIQSARSGFPFSVLCNCGLGRPSVVGDPFANVPAGRYMNAAAFSTSAGITTLPANPAGTVIQFGNEKRNAYTGPAIWNTDVSVFKNTAIRENLKFQLGLEFFNFWNHAKRTVPQNNMNDGAFGRFDSFFPGRVIQYRAKLIF